MSRISRVIVGCLLIVVLSATIGFAAYKPTNLDTKLPPYDVSYDIEKPSDAEQIYENETYIYYFKDDRDVLVIYDKRNGYTWKSGLDIASSKDVKAALRKDEPLGFEPLEDKMNKTFTGIANSLISLEYYDDSNNIKRLASAGEEATSSLLTVEGEENHFVLDVQYSEFDLSIRVHLFLTQEGYDIKIYNEEILGSGKEMLAAVMLNPFLGASGGRYQLYDEETGKHGEKIAKPEIPGYVFIPDGSGALVRFNDYMVALKTYEGKVYGGNLAKSTYNYTDQIESFKPFKEPVMPLYGIAHGNQQAAFLGYATQGDEHMEIIVVPEENTTLYTWAYPRFVFNNLYYQIFNKRGDGYFTTEENQKGYDISFSYNFLAGSGETGYQADYVGMALAYREHLISEGTLTEQVIDEESIPIRLDFVMSDQKKSVIGYENVVTTTSDEVRKILDDLVSDGLTNINSGLYGWQDGGITVAKPWETDFVKSIGSKGNFESLIADMNQQGLDISFATDYVNIAEEQVKFLGNATKHVNNWYLRRQVYTDVPFTDFAYAKPYKSAKWLDSQIGKLEDLNIASHTIEGISSILLSEHGQDTMSEEEVILLYQETLDQVDESLKLNLKAPNQYLWAYTDRYLQAPVYPTQFLIETDTVPFLELVLSGTMEVYAPYSNFSFSGDKDVLRMIDYNIYPSFVLTEGASYLLSATNSLDMYSTEYSQYEEVIKTVYSQVNGALGEVMDTRWISREVLIDGVIMNRYEDGTMIIINYTDDSYDYEGSIVNPISYQVIR